jgi:hypothetical protein
MFGSREKERRFFRKFGKVILENHLGGEILNTPRGKQR